MADPLDLDCALADVTEDARMVQLLMDHLFDVDLTRPAVTMLREDAETLLHAAIRVVKGAREAHAIFNTLAPTMKRQEPA